MEKRVWTMPCARAEQFEVNEYIAACWSIACAITPHGCGYKEDNGIEGLQTIYDAEEHNGNLTEGELPWVADTELVCSGIGCSYGNGGNVVHEVGGITASAPYANGWWLPADNKYGSAAKRAFYFYYDTGVANTSVYHFCDLNDVQWEKNPNAS